MKLENPAPKSSMAILTPNLRISFRKSTISLKSRIFSDSRISKVIRSHAPGGRSLSRSYSRERLAEELIS